MEFKEANEAAPEERHFIKLKVRDSVFGDLFHDSRRSGYARIGTFLGNIWKAVKRRS